MPSRFATPQEHPTFQRAIGLASRKALSDAPGWAERIARARKTAPSLDREEAATLAVAQAAQAAYEEAVGTLQAQSPRRARVEYAVPGEEFLNEALVHLRSQTSEPARALAKALEGSKGFMPETVLVAHEFGLLEDGLICGRSHARAVGGNFAMLQSAALECLESLTAPAAAVQKAPGRHHEREESMYGWEDEEFDAPAAPLGAGARLAAQELASRCFPRDGADLSGRVLFSNMKQMSARLERLSSAWASFDDGELEEFDGRALKSRLEAVAILADKQRDGAAALSEFFLDLGH